MNNGVRDIETLNQKGYLSELDSFLDCCIYIGYIGNPQAGYPRKLSLTVCIAHQILRLTALLALPTYI